jgi:hypothetical protein
MESIKFTCDLSTHFDFDKIEDVEYLKENNIKKYTRDNVHVLKYDKDALNASNYMTLGLFRSVVVKDGAIKCIAPFKSIPFDILFNYFKDNGPYQYSFHEFVEGTMVNLFHTGEDWEVATRSLLGGKGKFYKDSKSTFRTMFLECMNACDFEFSDLNKDYCYSFVIQHPENRIVKYVTEPQLYLCAVFKPEGTKVHAIDYQKDGILSGKVRYPAVYPETTVEAAQNVYANKDTTRYDVQGVVIEYGFYRSKLRNPTYEHVRQLRGNQPKSQFQYLTLRKTGAVKEFLGYFPEFKERFAEYRSQVHTFTSNLHQYYVQCFVKKQQPLQQFAFEYRPHMIELHKKYVGELIGTGRFIDRGTVIEYINNVEPRKLMFALNYHHRPPPSTDDASDESNENTNTA